jgi:hypothetical protein
MELMESSEGLSPITRLMLFRRLVTIAEMEGITLGIELSLKFFNPDFICQLCLRTLICLSKIVMLAKEWEILVRGKK